jgi:SAM-dependent methyltransferase
VTARDPTHRFGDRVATYVRYRPGYPAAVLDVLREEGVLAPGHVVADLGSGTGISATLFLDAGHAVHAVEPNGAMRAAAETRLGDRPGFHSHDGTAERTGLPDASVDLAVAAQAFHWFDAAATAAECARIVRPGGARVLLWNSRLIDASAFARDYEALLVEHGTDYAAVNHQHNLDPAALTRVLGEGRVRRSVPNEQRLDRDGLRGRVLSASYAPNVGEPGHDAMMLALDTLFARHARGGAVLLPYETEVHIGRG